MSLGQFSAFNWFDLSEPLPKWWFIGSMIFGQGGAVFAMNLQAIVARRLAPDLQVRFAALYGISGPLGRTIGPIWATASFGWAQRTIGGKGAGINISAIYNLCFGFVMTFVIMGFFFKRIFGLWDDPAPISIRKAKEARKEDPEKTML